MAKIYNPPQQRTATRASGALLGVAVSGLLFLAIPLTQIFTDFKKSSTEIQATDVAPPPPPPPPEEPPPPPEPEKEEPPPELDTPPPPISLEQLDLALNPGTGGSLSGDFALPTVNLNQKDLGMDIFDIGDLEKKPLPRKQGAPTYPPAAKRKGLQGYAIAEFIIDENGSVIDVKITKSSDPIFDRPTINAIRAWKFTPGENGGRAVKTRTRVKIPFNIQ